MAGALALLAAGGMAFTSFQKANSEFSSLLMKNVEALAIDEVEDCDLAKYQRHYREVTEQRTGTATSDAYGYITISGIKYGDGKLGKHKLTLTTVEFASLARGTAVKNLGR